MSLKIVVIYTPPRVERCALDPICPTRGYGIDYTRFVCQALQLNCTFVWYTNRGSESSDYGDVLENGTATGLLGAIQRGEYDTSLPAFTPTYRRSKSIDFSEAYDQSDTLLVTRAPSFQDEEWNWNLVNAFQGDVWLAFALVMTLAALAISLMINFFKKIAVPFGTSSSLFDLCRSLIMIDFKNSDTRLISIRKIVCTWIVCALVIGGAYSGILYSQKVSIKYNLPFRDLETLIQCLEKGQCRMITPSTTNVFLQLTGSNNELGNRVKASLDKYPRVTASTDRIPEAILNEKNQYWVTVGPSGDRLAWIKGNRDCLFYTMKMPDFQTYAFPFVKNSSFPKMLNSILFRSREMGLVKALNRRYYMSESLCQEDWNSRRPASLNLRDGRMLFSMANIFYFYALGIFIGSIVLAFEVLINYFLSATEGVVMFILRKTR